MSAHIRQLYDHLGRTTLQAAQERAALLAQRAQPRCLLALSEG